MSKDSLYLNSIKECIDRIEQYTCDGKDAFLNTTMIQDAVIRNLLNIGEATKQLSQEVRQTHTDIPWKKIAGLRDVLIHDYLQVNLSRVWAVIEGLPELKTRIIDILHEVS